MMQENGIVHNTYLLRMNIASIAIAMVLISCVHSLRNESSDEIDIRKEGFIGADILQISLIVPPDAHVKGLVARRENARNKSENNFTKLLVKKIVEYRKANMAPCKTATEEILFNQAKDVVENAVKAAEFYTEDESFAVIVRISRKNIRKALECPSAVEDKSSIQKIGGKKS